MKKLIAISIVVLGVAAVSQAATWNVPGDFATIQDAINGVLPGDQILVGAGTHAGAFITKAVEIKGEDGAVISSGPAHGSGMIQGFRLLAGSDGATISHMSFTVDLAIMNGAAVGDVTVDHCTFTSPVQGISNWGGSGWQISHNVITDLRTRNGGGIGILIADRSGGIVSDNVVSHNKITGTLYVGGACPSDPSCEKGGYNGSGIVIYADFRYSWPGAVSIEFNRVIKNKVSLVSDTPGVVDVAAFELTDTRVAPTPNVVHDNAIGFNDFRGTALQVVLTPSDLDLVNDISRNLGENRGHGLHPSVFGPSGE